MTVRGRVYRPPASGFLTQAWKLPATLLGRPPPFRGDRLGLYVTTG